jgi:hypothetical protein
MTKTRRRAVTLATLVVVWTSACTTWHPSEARPGDLIPAERPSAVRVTSTDGTVTTVVAPVLRNDSIVSREIGRNGGVAAADVGVVEVRRFSPARTLGLVAAGVVAAATWAAVATGSSGSGGDPLPLPKLSPNLLHGFAWLGGLFH